MRVHLFLFASAVVVGSLFGATEPLSVGEKPAPTVEGILGYILSNSYKEIDAKRCETPLRNALMRARFADWSEQNSINHSLQKKGCLDRWSSIHSATPPPTRVTAPALPGFLSPSSTLYSQTLLPPLMPQTVKYERIGSYAYVQITRFAWGTGEKFKAVVEDIVRDPPQVLVLDLRGNPGGFLSQAYEVLDAFSPQPYTPAVSMHYRSETWVDHKTHGYGPLAGLPTVILVDGGTISAAELTAAVLREWYPKEVIMLVGSPTFGKGLMQVVHANWWNTLGITLTLTEGEFFPGANMAVKVDGVGLTPDIRVVGNASALDVALRMVPTVQSGWKLR